MDLPERYVAFKPYFNDSFPDNPANRELLTSLGHDLAERSHVVVLSTDEPMDDHSELVLPASAHIHPVGPILDPRTNLDLQTELIAGAERFVTPYGGASYLGLLTGTPTHAFYSERSFNEVHLRTAREACAATRSNNYYVIHASDLPS
jgi:ADP-heptose:LPS heptosyltransferase